MAKSIVMFHFIYKTTCLITNRFYVGMHSTLDMSDGYLGSGKILRRSIEKYGEATHVREILEFAATREELKRREREIVDHVLVNEELCMNLQLGGQGGFVDAEHQLKCSRAGGNASRLRDWTDDLPRLKEKGSSIFKRLHAEGKLNSSRFKGKKHSAESLEKMSACKSGANNPMAGTCWINDGQKALVVKREELSTYLEEGYVLGRKIRPHGEIRYMQET